jgi:hypothetical protein
MPTSFLAVSNLQYNGHPPMQGYPADERRFASLEDAVRWLKSLKCGGSISDFDRVVREIQPGEE